VTGRLRTLLRRLGMGERRWIPGEPERTTHAGLVRSRLPDEPPDAPGPGSAADPAGTGSVESTDSVR